MDYAKLKMTVDEFKEKRRKQDNDLFYYINTMVEVDNILYELRNALEDAKKENREDDVKKIEAELEDWQSDYQDYIDECERILQDMHLSQLSSYDEVEAKQDSLEWDRVKLILAYLTEYHDILNSLSVNDPHYEESLKEMEKLANWINSRYRRLYADKEIEEYNTTLFGEPKSLIKNIPSVEEVKENVPFESYEDSIVEDDSMSFDEVLRLQEQKAKEKDSWLLSTLPHIKDEEIENWKVYAEDIRNESMAKILVSYMEKLEKGYPIEKVREEIRSEEKGDELLYRLSKYSKEYRVREDAFQKEVEEKMNTPFKPVVEDNFVYPTFLPEVEDEHFELKEWPVLDTPTRNSKDVVAELFFYIHKYDLLMNKKTDLGKVIEATHIGIEELSMLNIEQKSTIDSKEEIESKIRELLEEYKALTNKEIDVDLACGIVYGSLEKENKEKKGKPFAFIRKASDKLKETIQKHKKALFAVAFAGLVITGLASGKMMNRGNIKNSVNKVSIENNINEDEMEKAEPLVLESNQERVIHIDSVPSPSLAEVKEASVSLSDVDDNMDIHVGDKVQFKDNALIFRTEYLNTNFGGDMQGRIPTYPRDVVRDIQGIGFRMPNGTVKLVFDQERAKELYEQGNPIYSVYTFDGFYQIGDTIVVENGKGMSL